MTQHVVPNAARGGLYQPDASALDRLVRAADAHQRGLSAGTVRRTGKPDALARVRGNLRPALEKVADEWDERIAADRADPDRKWLTKEGIEYREASLRRQREEAVDAAVAPFLRELAQAERDVAAETDKALRPPTSREDFDDADAIARHMRDLTPSVGIAQAAAIIADAAGTAAGNGVIRELLPHLRSLHDGPGAYSGDDDVKVLIHQTERLVQGPERELAESRAGILERTKWGAAQLVAAAKTGDRMAFRTTVPDGEGGERPAILGDGAVAESSDYDVEAAWPSKGFRRLNPSSDSQRAADAAAMAGGDE